MVVVGFATLFLDKFECGDELEGQSDCLNEPELPVEHCEVGLDEAVLGHYLQNGHSLYAVAQYLVPLGLLAAQRSHKNGLHNFPVKGNIAILSWFLQAALRIDLTGPYFLLKRMISAVYLDKPDQRQTVNTKSCLLQSLTIYQHLLLLLRLPLNPYKTISFFTNIPYLIKPFFEGLRKTVDCILSYLINFFISYLLFVLIMNFKVIVIVWKDIEWLRKR